MKLVLTPRTCPVVRDSFRRRGWNLPVPRARRLSVTSTNYPTRGSIRLFEDGSQGHASRNTVRSRQERSLRHKLKLVRQMSADRLRRVRSECGCLQLKSGGTRTCMVCRHSLPTGDGLGSIQLLHTALIWFKSSGALSVLPEGREPFQEVHGQRVGPWLYSVGACQGGLDVSNSVLPRGLHRPLRQTPRGRRPEGRDSRAD